MTEKIRCKACGFIMNYSNSFDRCPACGVPRSAFEDFEDRMPKTRRSILSLHLHQISVHFPQAFTVIIPVLVILSYVFTMITTELMTTARFVSVALPFAVLSAYCAGLIDGKARFKRLDTSHLLKKIITGLVFFIAAVAIFITALKVRDLATARIVLLSLSGLALVCQVILGITGSSLTCAELP